MLILGCSSARWGSHKALPKREGREGIQTEFGSKCQWGVARVLKPIWELHLYQMMDRRMKLEIRNRIFVSCRGDRTRGAMAAVAWEAAGQRVTGQAIVLDLEHPAVTGGSQLSPAATLSWLPAAKAVCRDKGPVNIKPRFPPSPRSGILLFPVTELPGLCQGCPCCWVCSRGSREDHGSPLPCVTAARLCLCTVIQALPL